MGNESSMDQRDGYIDLLRAFGLICLIIAHTAAPSALVAFRSFDVPLMVFLSAICFKPSAYGYLAYVIHRFKRIYFPVFYFLLVFCAVMGVGSLFVAKIPFSWYKVAGSFLLLNEPSFGYVWIMRVFLMVALMMPLVYHFAKNAGLYQMAIVIITLFIINEVIVRNLEVITYFPVHFIVEQYVVYLLAYSVIIILGIWGAGASTRNLFIMLGVLAVAFIGYLLFNESFAFRPQADKYPPHGQYLIYGCFCSLFLWSIGQS